jgi:hypothetical protein
VNTVTVDDRLTAAPVVIVADFANTAPRLHSCIVSEIVPLLRKYEARPGITILANGPSSEFVQHIDIGKGNGLNLLLSRSNDRNIQSSCAEARSAEPSTRFEDPYFGGRDAMQTVWGIIKGWETSNRLVRVFWIAGDFTWFDALDAPVCIDKPDQATCKTESRKRSGEDKLPSPYVVGLSKAGVSFFPVLIPGTAIPEVMERKRREPLVGAEYMAAVGGGFVAETEHAKPGETLLKTVEATDDSYTVELSGPAGDTVEMLHVQTEAAAPVTLKWQRPYVTNPQNAITEELRRMPFRAARLFVPSRRFSVRYDTDGPKIHLLLPDFVVNATPGDMYVLLDYVEPPLPFKYRKTLHRGVDECLCMPVEPVVDRLEFRIVVYDETMQWVAASTISLRRNRPPADQDQPQNEP